MLINVCYSEFPTSSTILYPEACTYIMAYILISIQLKFMTSSNLKRIDVMISSAKYDDR